MPTPARICIPVPSRAPRAARDRADPDADVIGLASKGDLPGALRRLMQRHGAAVYRYCHEALRDAALTDDVYQQVFIEVFRDLPRFGGRSPVRIWLFAIARHQVLDAVRARGRAHSHMGQARVFDAMDPRPSPGDSLDDARRRQALVASLGELSEPVRIAVLLRYQEGCTFEEMAEICREKPCTLRARVVRALPRLRERIESHITGSSLISP